MEAAEDYLLLRGRSNVVSVILEVLSKHMKADAQEEDGTWASFCVII